MTSPLTILPEHQGKNLADITPLLRIGEGDKTSSSSLTDAIKERFVYFKNHQESTFKEMISAAEEVALFLQGKQFLMPNPFRPGGWLPYAVKNPNEMERRALSMMQYHVSGNLEKWENSNPDIRVKAGIQADEAYEAAQAAEIVVEHYERKFFYPRITQAECLEGLTAGTYLWRLRLDPTLKSVTAYRQIFENRKVEIGPGWGKCSECGREGKSTDFNEVPGEGIYTCPLCHGEALVIPPASGEIASLAGSEKVELGDFRLDLVPFAQCRWDLRYHADESPWLIIRRRTSMSAVRQILGNIEIPLGQGSDIGLDTVDRLAYSGQAMAGYSRSQERPTLYKEPATVEEFWMSPDEYGDIRLQREAKTVSGGSIPKDVRLGDLLKGKTICVLGLNEMSTVLGLFVEDHRDYIVQGKWYAKPGTGAGRGLQDLAEVQKVFNSDHQQTHTYLRSIATPAMLVASEILGEEGRDRYLGIPGFNIPIPLARLAEGVGLDQLVRPAFQAQGVPAQFFEFTYNRLSEFAQFASHFLPFASGMPGVDNRTATGAQITQAATNALYTPVLSVKAEVRKLIAEKLVKLYPKHFPIERYFPQGGKHGRHTGRWLSGADLNVDLIFEVVQDSWNPRNSYTKRQDYAAVAQMFGGIIGWLEARKVEPERVGDIERAFDLELESETRNVAESLCFRRVRQMQAVAKLVDDPLMLVGVMPDETGQMVSTGQGAIQPPISKAEPAHEVKRQWFMEFLDSDDGQEAPPVLRRAVEILIVLHSEYATQQASYLANQQGQVQMAAAEPQMQAQAEMQQQQAQMGIEQQRQQMELEAQRAVGEQVASEADVQTQAVREDIKNQALREKMAIRQADREHQMAVGRAQKG